MQEALNKLISKFESWLDSIILILPNAVIALIVVVLFFFLSRYIKKLCFKFMSKFSENEAVNRLMSNILTAIFLLIGLFLGLSIMGLDKTVTSLLAGAGVVGLAVGLAFQDPILNIISGVVMSLKKPFNIGDTISSNGYNGVIKTINLRAIHLKTFTGEDVFIPNKAVLQNPMENFTLTKWRRVDIECGVDYSSNLENVKEIAVKTIESRVAHDETKAVEFIYTEFGDSSINFNLRYWLEMSEEADYLVSKSDAIIELKKAFDKDGISIPFPMRTIEFSSPININK